MADDLKKNRIRAVMMGTSLGIAFLAVVYARVQKEEADRQKALALENKIMASECERHQKEFTIKLERQMLELQRSVNEAAQQRAAIDSKTKK